MLEQDKFKEHVEQLFPSCVGAIKALVSYNSVLDESAIDSEYPFGKTIDDALRATLDICDKMGMKTFYGNGYYGYAEFGSGEEMIGVLGHIDVVPAEDLEAWDTDPFKAQEKDGNLYGRGTKDDKGPMMTALYGFYALKQMGVSFTDKRIRFIFGTDEESLWRCIDQYMKNEEVPSMGFTPDAVFPLIYAEKSLLEPKLKSHHFESFSLKGGSAFNVVPNECTYEGAKTEELKKALEELNFEYTQSGDKVTVLGKSAHASKNELGINAITRMAMGLYRIGIKTPAIEFLALEVKEDFHGETLLGQLYEDEPSGKLSLNIGKILIESGKEEIWLDSRIPVKISMEEIVEKIKEKCRHYGVEYHDFDSLPSLYVPKDHPLIKTLLKVYQDATGLDAEPLSTGGATYAKSMKNCVAFGPLLPGRVSTEHQANEYMVLEDIKLCMEIYGKAIYELTRA